MTHERLHRLLRLILLLQGGAGLTANALAAELEVSRRTLFRDLSALQEAGFRIVHEPGVGYRVPREHLLPPLQFTAPEVVGLMVFRRFLEAGRGQPLSGPTIDAIGKALSTVPAALFDACDAAVAGLSVDEFPRDVSVASRRFFPVLQRCIDERRSCRFQYRGPLDPAPIEGEFEPYALHFAVRTWYVFGHSAEHREVRMFKLSRFESIEPLDTRFHRPHGFNVRDKLGRAWQLVPEGRVHHVVLEFAPRVARNVAEVHWHPTQKTQMLSDGRCRVSFDVDGLGEIAWWLCGYADQVNVIEPAALRHRLRTMLVRAVQQHEQSDVEE